MSANAFQELGIDSVPPGSLLAAAVQDANGATLLPAGAAVTESQLQSLRRRGIETLCVQRPQVEDPEASAAELKRLEARIEHLFRHVGDNAIARDIKQRVLDFRRRPS